jgi:hypothetical protein
LSVLCFKSEYLRLVCIVLYFFMIICISCLHLLCSPNCIAALRCFDYLLQVIEKFILEQQRRK